MTSVYCLKNLACCENPLLAAKALWSRRGNQRQLSPTSRGVTTMWRPPFDAARAVMIEPGRSAIKTAVGSIIARRH